MLKICLSRKGKTKQPVYRIVVTEKHRDPWGDVLETIGFYDPRSTPKRLSFKKDRIEYWVSKGAQLSATVHNMMVNEKVIEGAKRRVVQPKLKEKADNAPARHATQGVAGGDRADKADSKLPQKNTDEKPAEAPKA